jgi:hypothetical protein
MWEPNRPRLVFPPRQCVRLRWERAISQLQAVGGEHSKNTLEEMQHMNSDFAAFGAVKWEAMIPNLKAEHFKVSVPNDIGTRHEQNR